MIKSYFHLYFIDYSFGLIHFDIINNYPCIERLIYLQCNYYVHLIRANLNCNTTNFWINHVKLAFIR